jgi:hypothetical protein
MGQSEVLEAASAPVPEMRRRRKRRNMSPLRRMRHKWRKLKFRRAITTVALLTLAIAGATYASIHVALKPTAPLLEREGP